MDRMQFIVEFATMDLDRLRAGDWLNLQDDLKRFLQTILGPKGGILTMNPGRAADRLSSQQIRELQLDTKRVLQTLLETKAPEVDYSKEFPGFKLTDRFRIEGTFAVVSAADQDRNVMVMFGGIRDRLLFTFMYELSQASTSQIKKCPRC